ncbi:HEAT repeat domain-containing protein [Candidatus Neomarinimicrobiota bacterium]
MIQEIIQHLDSLTPQDRLFIIFAFVISILLVAVFVFALYIVYLRLRNVRIAEQWARMEAKWEPLLLDYITEERSRDEILSEIPREESLHFVDYLQRFAERLQGSEAALLKQLAAPYLNSIAERTKGGDPPRRARAVRTIGALGLQQHSEALIDALEDESPLVAMIAARALTDKEYPEYAEAVLDKLHRFDTWSQSYLVSMLASVGPEITPALRHTLADPEKSVQVRAVAADALRSLNDLEAGDIAAQVLDSESDMNLVAAALRLIQIVGRPEHLTIVRKLALSEEFVVRAQALKALGLLGGEEEWPLLREGLEHDSNWVALNAAQGLTSAGGKQILYEILQSGHQRSDLVRQVLTSA